MAIKLNVNTNQDAFDAVVRHLKAQNRQASWDGACAYRTPSGLKCAIGALIDDDCYTKSLEGVAANKLELLTDVSIPLLQDLQMVHDIHTTWSNTDKMQWVSPRGVSHLKRIARQYDLDASVVDEEFYFVTGNEISGLRQ
jgi:hypothetical protein